MMERIIHDLLEYKIDAIGKINMKDDKIHELHIMVRNQGKEIERLKRMMSYMTPPPFPGNKGQGVMRTEEEIRGWYQSVIKDTLLLPHDEWYRRKDELKAFREALQWVLNDE